MLPVALWHAIVCRIDAIAWIPHAIEREPHNSMVGLPFFAFDSRHGEWSEINKIYTYFLLLPYHGYCSIVALGSNTGMGFLRTNDLQLRPKW